MAWHDKGLIFKVDNLMPWAKSHAYLPTAIMLKDRIRVFVAFWDENNYGRLGYIDTDIDDPSVVLGYSKSPLIGDSQKGMFDCDGVSPLSILEEEGLLKLYYAGWNIKHEMKGPRYTLFMGLLLSIDEGATFRRFDKKAVIGPRHSEEFVRTGGFVCMAEGEYMCYLSSQKGHHNEFGKALPFYDLELTKSPDGVKWTDKQNSIFTHKYGVNLGFGRPCIWQNEQGIYEGLFSLRRWNGQYSDILYSRSPDGVNWGELTTRGKAFSHSATIDKQKEVSFPSVIKLSDNRLAMFYNGNSFGKEGLRLAIFDEA